MIGVLAHGFGGRVDLPVPRSLFVFGAATALVVSFVALSVLWREPRLEGGGRTRALGALRWLLASPVVEWIVRGLACVVFAVVTVAAFVRADATETIAPVFVFDWFWVGLAFAHALFGNLWATLSPFDTLGRLLLLDEPDHRPPLTYPKAWGRWPAAVLLFGFVWLELVDPFAGVPGALGYVIVGYSLLSVAGMILFGRKAWVENGEAFAVYLGLLARLAPLGRDGEGRVVIRAPLSGLASLEPRPGVLAVILVALGSTTFDGLSRTTFWVSRASPYTGWQRTALDTLAMLGVILLMAGAYALAMAAAGRIVDGHWHPVAARFAHSLVPIVFAYLVAHYFSFLLIEGQVGLSRISDPLGRGWDLFGTAGRTVNLALLSATLIWYVQVAAIVLGHVGGVMLAHDRAISWFEARTAIRTQYALLAVMVLFTSAGLLILSG
ncbi:MAG: hypothetical protein ACE14W_06785 [Candidatus Velamenicoccus archaeovorus]